MRDTFVGEPIQVDVGSIDPRQLSRGAPGCPKRFSWRGRIYSVAEVLEESKQLRAHDSSEKYVKSHSFRVLTEDGYQMVLRCDRQVRGNPWRLLSMRPPGSDQV